MGGGGLTKHIKLNTQEIVTTFLMAQYNIKGLKRPAIKKYVSMGPEGRLA